MVQMPRGADSFAAGSFAAASFAAGYFVAGASVTGALRGALAFAVRFVVASVRAGGSALRVVLAGVDLVVGSLLDVRAGADDVPEGEPDARTLGAAGLGAEVGVADALAVAAGHRAP
jgi:hypothetical protein